MTISSLSNTCNSWLTLDNSSYSSSTASTNSDNSTDSSTSTEDSTSDLSPAAMLLNLLHQLRTQNTDSFMQATEKLAENLRSAAAEAAQKGDTAKADQLNQLADHLDDSSKTGDFSDFENLFSSAIQRLQSLWQNQSGSTDPFSIFQASADTSDSTNDIFASLVGGVGNSTLGSLAA